MRENRVIHGHKNNRDYKSDSSKRWSITAIVGHGVELGKFINECGSAHKL